jgi:Ala-tRNA(Pro) deacylase
MEDAMNASHRMELYLMDYRIPFDMLEHEPTATSLQTALAAGIEAGRLAKAVLLAGEDCMLAAVVPANQDVRLGQLAEDVGQRVHLADEATIRDMFSDCDPGTMPGLPNAWGLETVWDDALLAQPDIYLEAGDHRHLFHVDTRDLRHAFADLTHCRFSGPKHTH